MKKLIVALMLSVALTGATTVEAANVYTRQESNASVTNSKADLTMRGAKSMVAIDSYMYKEPSTDGEIEAYIPDGAIVISKGEVINNMVLVRYKGVTGYVSVDLLLRV